MNIEEKNNLGRNSISENQKSLSASMFDLPKPSSISDRKKICIARDERQGTLVLMN